MGRMKDFDLALYDSVYDGIYSVVENHITFYGGDIDVITRLGMEAIEYFLDQNKVKHTIEYFICSNCRQIACVSWIDVDEEIHNGLWYIEVEG